MKNKKIISTVVFLVIGGLGGYLYWYFIGCTSGTCPITSKWINTTLYGALLGYLLGSSIYDMVEKNKKVAKVDTEK